MSRLFVNLVVITMTAVTIVLKTDAAEHKKSYELTPQNQTVAFRPGTLADAQAVVGITGPENGWTVDAVQTTMQNPERYQWTMAVKDGQPVGCATCYLRFSDDQTAMLTSLAVDPSFRKQGIGQGLVRHELELAYKSGCYTVILDVEPDNIPAIKLYQKLGFKRWSKFTWQGVALQKMVHFANQEARATKVGNLQKEIAELKKQGRVTDVAGVEEVLKLLPEFP
ncbi:MAG: ribosomal-protein-alanine N-acetyltransferase [Bacillota bacterium]|jgi:ribosomal protein S18 acetylase RimI-like enzyme